MFQFLHQVTNCADFCLFELSLSVNDLQYYGNVGAVAAYWLCQNKCIPPYLVVNLSLYVGFRFAGLLLRFLRIFHFAEKVRLQLTVNFQINHSFFLYQFYKFKAGLLSNNLSVLCVLYSTHVSSLYDWHTHSVCYCSIEMSFSHHAMQNVWLWNDFWNFLGIQWKWMKNYLNLYIRLKRRRNANKNNIFHQLLPNI